jgi:hypothetical protein
VKLSRSFAASDRSEAAVVRQFQQRMPYRVFVPDVDAFRGG